MGVYSRIGTYLFIFGAVLSVADAAFPSPIDSGIVFAALIFTGVFAGLLNVTMDEEHRFLVSAAAFLLVILGFNQIFAGEQVISQFSRIFHNSVAFIGSMALVVALKEIVEYGADDYTTQQGQKRPLIAGKTPEELLSPGMRVWHGVIFVSVALTFLIILLNGPFYEVPQQLLPLVSFFEWAIILIFIIDLFVLYHEHKPFGRFVRTCWIDILAAIPVWSFFGALKGIRLARIARLSHSFKFFSNENGMDEYLREARTPQRKPGKRA